MWDTGASPEGCCGSPGVLGAQLESRHSRQRKRAERRSREHHTQLRLPTRLLKSSVGQSPRPGGLSQQVQSTKGCLLGGSQEAGIWRVHAECWGKDWSGQVATGPPGWPGEVPSLGDITVERLGSEPRSQG